MRPRDHLHRITAVLMIALSAAFCVFVLQYEQHARHEAQKQVENHARVIADALWNYNYLGASEYLALAVRTYDYERLLVKDSTGVIFADITAPRPDALKRVLLRIHLIPRVHLAAPVVSRETVIGRVEVIWQSETIYMFMDVLFTLVLVIGIVHLIIRNIQARRALEYRVRERTAELATANASLHQEITDRKNAETALRESEEKFRSISAHALDAIIMIDPRGRICFWNRAAEKVFGYSSDEILGQDLHVALAPDTYRKAYLKAFSGFQATGSGNAIGKVMEFSAVKKDGTEFPIELSVSALELRGQWYAVGIVRDVSERRRAEVERERLQAELRQSQKMEAIGTLAGGIAHDFNNLLMGIQGNVSLMMLDVPTSHDHYARLKSIEQQVQSGADLTRQLLGFARGGKYEVKPTDINRMIRGSLDVFGRTRKEIAIRMELKDGLWTVEVDRVQLEQVLLNIYVNAWQAMPHGGELTIRTENIELRGDPVGESELPPGTYVRVSVSDTGPGIDPETKLRIFEPFFTTKEMGRGTGLGLASAYGIVKNHGGMIDVFSEPGHGSTFTVYLPASDKSVPNENDSSPAPRPGAGTVLLVDDEPMIVDVGQAMLERLGYRVITASSGRAALDIYEKNLHRIDIVLLDMVMPGLGGGQTYDRLKEINPDVKVLLSSGYAIDGQAMDILGRGCNGFVQKPFGLQGLSEKIQAILNQH